MTTLALWTGITAVLGFEVVREWDMAGYPDVDVGYISANGFMIEVVGTQQPFQMRKGCPLMCLPLCLIVAMCIWPLRVPMWMPWLRP